MKNTKKEFHFHPAFGLLGFLGILGFFTDPFFCIFFGFFGFFFWGLLGKEKADERLVENTRTATSIIGQLAVLLCFFILFALEKQVSGQIVLLWGSMGYGLVFALAPALAYYLDKRG